MVDALLTAAENAHQRDDMRTLESLALELIERCGDSDDSRLGLGHLFLAIVLARRSDADGARWHARRAATLFEAAGNTEGLLRAKVVLAFISGEVDPVPHEARSLTAEALAIARSLGDESRLAVVLGNYAEVCRQHGDFPGALRHAGEAAELLAKTGQSGRAAAQQCVIAHIYVAQHKFSKALEALDAARGLLDVDPIPRCYAWYFDVWLTIAVEIGAFETAARLYGFVDLYRDRHDVPRQHGVLSRLSSPIQRIFGRFDDQRALQLVEEGEALTMPAADDLARDIARGCAAIVDSALNPP
jgi:tetratricopeptide (TPR) repeat protein